MRVLLFTGKGGVGKTTAAAATAVRAAGRGTKTLVISTDPAHSLADAFGVALGPEPTEIDTGLAGMQIDAQSSFERSWRQVQAYLLEVLAKAGIDPIEAEELTVLPGADEVLALLAVRAEVESGRWDLVVVDCAPTAETLRLLALPEALDWYMRRLWPAERRLVRSLRPVLSRVSGVPMPADAVFDAVERLHAELAGVRAVLADPERTSVRLVLTPESVVVAESRRTLTTLSLYGYRVDGVIANRIFPSGDPWRDAWASAQAEQLASRRGVVRTATGAACRVPTRRAGRSHRPRRGRPGGIRRPRRDRAAGCARPAAGTPHRRWVRARARAAVRVPRRGRAHPARRRTVRHCRQLAPAAFPSVRAAALRRHRSPPRGGPARDQFRTRPGPLDALMSAPHSHGPLAEEAAKLAEALAGWVSSSGFAAPLINGAGQSPECSACPVCQLLRLARGGKPEVFAHLADASGSLLAALRAAVESSSAAAAAGERPPSERIDIR